MNVEQRREDRLLARGVSKGELFHPGSNQYIEVDRVHDISSMGVRLKVNASLTRGEKIRLGFQRGGAHLQLFGLVAWCMPIDIDTDNGEPESFMMGIGLEA